MELLRERMLFSSSMDDQGIWRVKKIFHVSMNRWSADGTALRVCSGLDMDQYV